jgi:hypothetical protein
MIGVSGQHASLGGWCLRGSAEIRQERLETPAASARPSVDIAAPAIL